MRSLSWFAVLALAAFGCSKPTPGLCCTDASDCATAGLPVGTSCDDGLACRGHQCVAEVCQTSMDCDATAPYCAIAGGDGLCTASCSADAECPGSGQSAGDRFCVTGACAQCRSNDDCGEAAPVCDGGSCRACAAHAECGSHVCAADGSCATEAEIAHVAPTGGTRGDCSQLAPCTLAYALASQPAHGYVLLAQGAYVLTAVQALSGKQVLVGDGAPRPTITRADTGTIFNIIAASDVQIDGLELDNATGSHQENGDAISCFDMSTAGTATVRLSDDVFRHNDRAVAAHTCRVIVSRSTFDANTEGLDIADLGGTIDRCTFTGNTYAMDQDDATVDVTNSFFTRNQTALYLTASDVKPASTYAFNTFADNQVGIDCQAFPSAPVSFANNIIARNATSIADGQAPQYSCSFPGSLITTDVATLHFVQPDAAPYDYHLGAGSVAIDAATDATLDHDFDGDARPKGKGRDVGADEAQ